MASVSRKIKRNMHSQDGGSRGLSDQEVGRALVTTRGDVKHTARLLNVHLATVYKRIAGNRELLRLRKRLELENV